MNLDCKTYLVDDEITVLELVEYVVVNVIDAFIKICSEIVLSVHFLIVLSFVFCVFAAMKIKNLLTNDGCTTIAKKETCAESSSI